MTAGLDRHVIEVERRSEDAICSERVLVEAHSSTFVEAVAQVQRLLEHSERIISACRCSADSKRCCMLNVMRHIRAHWMRLDEI